MFAACWASSAVLAQGRAPTVAPQGEARTVAGHVFTARASGRRPTPNVWVTLHRIGSDAAAPLDSMKTGASGDYAFRFRPSGDTSAVYLVSGRFAGIAYFTSPLVRVRTVGGDADLVVFDTASTGVMVTIESRHVVISAPDPDGRRRIVEVFLLANTSDRTRVAAAAAPTFRATLPVNALDPRIAEGDVSAEAITFAGGEVRMTAPVAPGTKRVSFAYFVPASRDPIAIAATDSTAMLEVLVEDSAATVAGNVVREESPASLVGRTFRRYIGQGVASTAMLRITAPSGSRGSLGAIGMIVVAIGLGMTAVLAMTIRRGVPLGAPRPPPRLPPRPPLASPGGKA